MGKAKINPIEYQEHLIVKMFQNDGSLNIRYNKLPSWISELKGKHIELEESASGNYTLYLNQSGYRLARRLIA